MYSAEEQKAIDDYIESEGICLDFAGNEYCEDSCLGWTPGNRRCDCGNRRVSWEFYENAAGMIAYPQAY